MKTFGKPFNSRTMKKKFKNQKFTTSPNQSKIERASLKMIPFQRRTEEERG
jgi:hypothetical protein